MYDRNYVFDWMIEWDDDGMRFVHKSFDLHVDVDVIVDVIVDVMTSFCLLCMHKYLIAVEWNRRKKVGKVEFSEGFINLEPIHSSEKKPNLHLNRSYDRIDSFEV